MSKAKIVVNGHNADGATILLVTKPQPPSQWAAPGDVVLYGTKGLYRVVTVFDGKGEGICYSLKGLEGQKSEKPVPAWKCHKVLRYEPPK